ncbi:MAG: flagellar hook capping FlgD N-terminal domain-containing protein [Opitutales bacterium]
MEIAAISDPTAINKPQGIVDSSTNELGMDDFFELLTTQLTAQDPLNPMDNTEFISQMATFSSLTQMEQIAENTSVTQEQQLAAATVNLLGKQVEGTSPDGQVVAGIVDRVELIDEQMVPFVGDVQVPFDSIYKVEGHGE